MTRSINIENSPGLEVSKDDLLYCIKMIGTPGLKEMDVENSVFAKSMKNLWNLDAVLGDIPLTTMVPSNDGVKNFPEMLKEYDISLFSRAVFKWFNAPHLWIGGAKNEKFALQFWNTLEETVLNINCKQEKTILESFSPTVIPDSDKCRMSMNFCQKIPVELAYYSNNKKKTFKSLDALAFNVDKKYISDLVLKLMRAKSFNLGLSRNYFSESMTDLLRIEKLIEWAVVRKIIDIDDMRKSVAEAAKAEGGDRVRILLKEGYSLGMDALAKKMMDEVERELLLVGFKNRTNNKKKNSGCAL